MTQHPAASQWVNTGVTSCHTFINHPCNDRVHPQKPADTQICPTTDLQCTSTMIKIDWVMGNLKKPQYGDVHVCVWGRTSMWQRWLGSCWPRTTCWRRAWGQGTRQVEYEPTACAPGEEGSLHPRARQENHGLWIEGVHRVLLLNTGEAAPVWGSPVQQGC